MQNKLELKERIKSISSKAKSNWEGKARFRIENEKWLNYSAQIAMRVDSIIEDKKDFNQYSLAELLSVSPQQISKILKGEQNLTLKTIGNLSDALGIELISFPPYKDTYIKLTASINADNSSQKRIDKNYNNDLTFVIGDGQPNKIQKAS
jgi:transcriptional regulator with XRE-family HTH domain